MLNRRSALLGLTAGVVIRSTRLLSAQESTDNEVFFEPLEFPPIEALQAPELFG